MSTKEPPTSELKPDEDSYKINANRIDEAVIPILQKKYADYRFLMAGLFAMYIFMKVTAVEKSLISIAPQHMNLISGGFLVGAIAAGTLFFRTSKLLSDALTERGIWRTYSSFPKDAGKGSNYEKLVNDLNKRTLGAFPEKTIDYLMLMAIVHSCIWALASLVISK